MASSQIRPHDEPARAEPTGGLHRVVGIVGFSGDLRCTLWSSAMKQLAGREPGECLGQAVLDVFPFLRSVGDEPLLRDACAGKGGFAGPDWHRKEVGEPLLLERYYSPAARRGGETEGLLVVRDASGQLVEAARRWVVDDDQVRQEIAADLHDRIGQHLLTAKIKLDQFLQQASRSDQTELVTDCHRLIREAIDDTRSLIFEISPPMLAESGLVAAVEWFAEQLQQQHGLVVTVTANDQPNSSSQLDALLFRSIRELLLNTVKHAKADQAAVSIDCLENQLVIQVQDNGIGFPAAAGAAETGGFGLFSIRERLRLFDGQLELHSPPEGGSRAIIRLPRST